MKAIAFIIVVTIPIAVCANPQVDWETVHFDSLMGTVSEIPVQHIIDGLSQNDELPYRDYYEQGRTWACIGLVLNWVAWTNMATVGRDLPFNPPELKYIREHSGRDWTFWRELASIGFLKYDQGLPIELDAETERILGEIEHALAPILDPDRPNSVFGDRPWRRTADGWEE